MQCSDVLLEWRHLWASWALTTEWLNGQILGPNCPCILRTPPVNFPTTVTCSYMIYIQLLVQLSHTLSTDIKDEVDQWYLAIMIWSQVERWQEVNSWHGECVNSYLIGTEILSVGFSLEHQIPSGSQIPIKSYCLSGCHAYRTQCKF